MACKIIEFDFIATAYKKKKNINIVMSKTMFQFIPVAIGLRVVVGSNVFLPQSTRKIKHGIMIAAIMKNDTFKPMNDKYSINYY